MRVYVVERLASSPREAAERLAEALSEAFDTFCEASVRGSRVYDTVVEARCVNGLVVVLLCCSGGCQATATLGDALYRCDVRCWCERGACREGVERGLASALATAGVKPASGGLAWVA